MKSNKKIMKIIDIIYWLIIIVTVIIQSATAIHEGEVDFSQIKEANFAQCMQFCLAILFIMILQFICAIFRHIFITIIYFGIKTGYKKYNKEKLEKVDYKNENYYREIIPKISPAVLSYIDDFQLDEKDIVATLLSLQLKQKIEIDNQIEIKDGSDKNLTENEKYVLQNLKNGTLKNIDMAVFEQKVILDCKEKGLLEEKENLKQEIIKKIILCVIIYITIFTTLYKMSNIFNNYVANNDSLIPVFLIIILILFCTMVIYPLKTVIYIKTYYFMNITKPYIRNKKSKEINEKLEGLKKYIKDYSMIYDRKKEELNVWEDYLIYSVIFGQNTQIVKDIIYMINN